MVSCPTLSTRRRCLAGALVLLVVFAVPQRVTAQDRIGPRDDCAGVAAALSNFIEHEMRDKHISAISVALVDDQAIVWSRGFGLADPARGTPASAETVYRVGSVSKLFTDIGIMQLVERGELDLDAPVQRYLPDFEPVNPFSKKVTLRQLMSHRGGLVREPPVGHYFDDTGPSLAKTVASLNATQLIYEPETRTKYSNAGIAVVGYVLEKSQEQPFARYLKTAVLEPMGLRSSAFEPSDAINRRLAQGEMWSYDGRKFPAPPIQLGMSPAGSMYSTVNDLARFIAVLFNEGRGGHASVLRPETLRTMLAPQYAPKGQRTGYGIGFRITERDGAIQYGHGGAIYGFATQLVFRVDEKIGAVVISNVDVTNTVTGRIANAALDLMSAANAGRALPVPETTGPIDPNLARMLAGQYTDGTRTVELVERGGGLFLDRGNKRVRVRSAGGHLVTDGRTGFGAVIKVVGRGRIRIDGAAYDRVEVPKPDPPPERWQGLVGEYGWDHNVLFVFEKEGKLHVLIEWVELDALSEITKDVFAFPADEGLYHGERIVFQRDSTGRATQAIVAGMSFERRTLEGEGAETFHIVRLKDMDELRAGALSSRPPDEDGPFREPDLVDVATLDPGIKLDIRYATTNNFMQARFYRQPKAFMQRPAAEALVRVHRALKDQGYGLLIHDAYRPWFVTKMFWDATPADKKHFVADPAAGSRHNRGCAVDLTLYDLATGEPVEMVALFDEMTERSYPDYFGGTSLSRWHRELLRDAMEAEDFSIYEFEWWHFDYKDWKKYGIGNVTFEELAGSP